MTVYEFIEDWDNAELDQTERLDVLHSKVIEYNQENGTDHKPRDTVKAYEWDKRYGIA